MKIKHRHFSTIDSTSLYIKENFENVDDFSFASADYQFIGRGRSDRKWFSPIGENLLFSFVIKDPILISKFKELSIASAYVIVKYLQERFNIEAMIKWPNDVYVDGKKISGILLESHMNENSMDGLIIGIGLNVNQILFNSGLIHPATSIKLLKQKDYDSGDIAKELFPRFVKYFLSIKDGNDDFIHYAITNNYLKDKEVSVEINGKEEQVKVITLNYDCSLRVQLNDDYHDLISGEVHFLNN